MATEQEQSQARRLLQGLDTSVATLKLVNDHGDLCRDGLRAVTHLHLISQQLLAAIEEDKGVDTVADELHRSFNSITHEKATRRTADPT
jgi:hypothetical protein